MTFGKDTASDGLEIIVQHGESGVTMRLRGRFNIDSSPAVRDRLLFLLRAQTIKPVTVDLSDLSYIDSAGFATLIEGLKMAHTRQTTLCVQGLQGRLLHLFQVTGMSALFEKSGCGRAPSMSEVS